MCSAQVETGSRRVIRTGKSSISQIPCTSRKLSALENARKAALTAFTMFKGLSGLAMAKSKRLIS